MSNSEALANAKKLMAQAITPAFTGSSNNSVHYRDVPKPVLDLLKQIEGITGLNAVSHAKVNNGMDLAYPEKDGLGQPLYFVSFDAEEQVVAPV